MATKKIILLLIVLSVAMSGCLSSEDNEENEEDREAGSSSGGAQRQREMRTPEGMQEGVETPEETGVEQGTWTPEETGTQDETITQEGFEIPIETETQGELVNSRETGTPEIRKEPETGQTGVGEAERAGTVQPEGAIPKSHDVRLKNYLMIPSRLEINVGDTVVWKNYQESSMLVLTSREYLFPDETLTYGNTLEYTFGEPGSYNFSVKGYPKMQMTITVK